VVAGQERASVDDHVDLVRAGLHRLLGLGDLDRGEALARRERGRYRRDAHRAAAERLHAVRNAKRIDAHRGDRRHRGVAGLGPYRGRVGSEVVDFVKRCAALAALLLMGACSSGTASQARPSPSPSLASPSSSPLSSLSPMPLQRLERSLPSPIEETAAAAAGGKLYVMGGFNAAGASLNTVYVFDGTTWSLGPRLPFPLDHPSAATLDDRVYIAGGHSNGRDS